MTILVLVLKVLLIIYFFSALVGVICFIKDTSKWHNAEKKVEIIPSAERSEENGRNGSTGDRGDNNGDTGDGNDNDSTGDGNGDGDNNNRYSDDW